MHTLIPFVIKAAQEVRKLVGSFKKLPEQKAIETPDVRPEGDPALKSLVSELTQELEDCRQRLLNSKIKVPLQEVREEIKDGGKISTLTLVKYRSQHEPLEIIQLVIRPNP